MSDRLRFIVWMLVGMASAGCRHDGAVTSSTSTGDTGETGASSPSDAGTLATADADVTTLESGDSGAESTGPPAVCGNALVEPGEQCDGDDVAGNPCPAACRFEPQTVLWELRFDGGNTRDRPHALAALPSGRVVVAGESDLTGLLASISATGELEWIEYPDVYRVNDLIVLDDALVAGGIRFEGSMWIGHFSLDGALTWEDTVMGPDELGPYGPGSVTALADGRIALTGCSDIDALDSGYLALYQMDGTLDELQTFAGPIWNERPMLSGLGILSGVAHGTGVVVSGRAHKQPASPAWMQKRELDGAVAWEAEIQSAVTSGSTPFFRKVSIAPDGSIAAVTGYKSVEDDPGDMWIGKYQPDGELAWSDIYEGEYGRNDIPVGVATDEDGGVFVHGTVSDDTSAIGAERDYDMVLLAYDANGERRWVDVYTGDGMGGGNYSWDYAGAVAVDTKGFILAAGYTMTPDTDYDVLVRLIAP